MNRKQKDQIRKDVEKHRSVSIHLGSLSLAEEARLVKSFPEYKISREMFGYYHFRDPARVPDQNEGGES